MSAAQNTAAEATVIELKKLIKLHQDSAASAPGPCSREAHLAHAAGYSAALNILIDHMTARGEEVPQ